MKLIQIHQKNNALVIEMLKNLYGRAISGEIIGITGILNITGNCVGGFRAGDWRYGDFLLAVEMWKQDYLLGEK